MTITEIAPIPHPPGRALPSLERYQYSIPKDTTIELDRYVDRLEAKTFGKLVGPVDFSQDINRAAVVASFPDDISESEFTDMLLLELLTEAATNSYALVFDESSDRYNAPWLKRFINNVWVPDEMQHADPFKWILLKFGYSEDDLNRRVRITQEATYEHSSGSTPVHLTTFGIEQEYLTSYMHGTTAFLLQPAAPIAAQRVREVQAREGVHTGWYGDLTTIQIYGNPKLVHYMAETTCRLSMPQNHLDPQLRELQSLIRDITLRRGAIEMEQNIATLINRSLGDKATLFGSFTLDFLARRKGNGLMLSAIQAVTKVPLLGDALTTLVAHAGYERVGIKHNVKGPEKLFQDNTTVLRSILLSRMQGVQLN